MSNLVHPFYKVKLIYQVSNYISEKRTQLLGDLVSYTNDPIRSTRRLRMIINLSEYETAVLKKIRDFETVDKNDFSDSYNKIIEEVESITNIGA